MGKYEEKPPTVDAVQWDGTPEGAKPLLDLLEEFGIRVGVKISIQHENPAWAYTRLEFDGPPRGYIGSGGPAVMHKKDWLVVHRERRFEIMIKEEFEHKYKEI